MLSCRFIKTLSLAGLIFVQGCVGGNSTRWNLPLLYELEIQQGNVVSQSMLDKLKVGMEKEKVRFIMGTPMIIDPFHSDRWEYIFIYDGGTRVRERRYITLHFEEDKLVSVSGDVKANSSASE